MVWLRTKKNTSDYRKRESPGGYIGNFTIRHADTKAHFTALIFINVISIALFIFLLHFEMICSVMIIFLVSVSTFNVPKNCLTSPMLSDFISQTLFNPNKTVVKMFVVMYDLRAMPAGHQTFLRQRTFSVPVRRDTNNQNNRKSLSHGRTLRYLVHLR